MDIEKLKQNIESLDLNYHPYIGDNFLNVKEGVKTILVGESFYEGQDHANLIKPEKGKLVVQDVLKGEYWDTRYHPNFHRVVAGNDNFEKNKLYDNIIYWNLIQRPMTKREKNNFEQPGPDDFRYGFPFLFKIIKKTKPDYCLVTSLKAANHFNQSVKDEDFEFESIMCHDKVGNCYPRTSSVTIDGHKTTLIFIKHCSQYFSWSKWRGFLQKKSPELMNWFDATLN